MKTSREQFECEMSKLGDCVDMRRAKNGDQEYMAWDVGLAWRMWQASRQCIEIESPELITTPVKQFEFERDCQWKEAISKAGIKVKGA